MKKTSFNILIIVISLVLSMSCNLSTDQAALTTEEMTGGERSISTTITTDTAVIDLVLNNIEKEKAQWITPYLSHNAQWSIAGDQAKISFAGTFIGKNKIEKALKDYFRIIRIDDLVTESTTETAAGAYTTYIRVLGDVPTTKKTFDMEYKYEWQFNSSHQITSVSVSYALVSMELALTKGGKGKIVSDVYASQAARDITNSFLPIKEWIKTTNPTYDIVRAGESPEPIPSNAIFNEIIINNVKCEKISAVNNRNDMIILHIHGGSFALLSPSAFRSINYKLALEVNVPVLSIDYRRSPENPFPAGLQDCFAVYKGLLEQYEAKNIIFDGESAGGNLVLTLLIFAKQNNLPLPGAVVSIDPWIDLTNSGETMITNAESETLLLKSFLDYFASLYLNGASPENPLISPLLANVSYFPPIYLASSTTEILLSDATRMFNKLCSSKIDTTIEIASGLVHVWSYYCLNTSDSDRTIKRVGNFIKDKLNIE